MAESTLQGWSYRMSISTSVAPSSMKLSVPAAKRSRGGAIEGAVAADGEGAADGMMVEGAEGAN